jgi:hypothetical protein
MAAETWHAKATQLQSHSPAPGAPPKDLGKLTQQQLRCRQWQLRPDGIGLPCCTPERHGTEKNCPSHCRPQSGLASSLPRPPSRLRSRARVCTRNESSSLSARTCIANAPGHLIVLSTRFRAQPWRSTRAHEAATRCAPISLQ